MKICLKYCYSIILLFTFLNCKSKDLRLYDPANNNEQKRHSIFAFGQYRFYNKFLFGSTADLYGNFEIVEVISVDHEGKKLITSPVIPEEPFEVKNGEDSVFLSNFIEFDGYQTYLFINPEKKYALKNITYSMPCGSDCTRNIQMKFNLYDSFKVFPITAKPGNFNFAGVFKITIEETTSDDPDGTIILSPDPLYNAMMESLGKFKKQKAIIIPEDGTLKKENLKNAISALYSNPESITLKSAEEKFYTEFIKKQKAGYWKEKAQALIGTNKK
ncbi:hypothetical protein LPTSP3_g00830 [Leptospira kobayashii]|uniref:Lipoprotein n=1 Tax=Leptospira kobayashii TaxID=1917830 RepID=A0ABM7UF73_9LEPT|nr:hypothetical protein [Leptospira kobayashii]BDA77153.1 hypothetical protein LPTSP3_g00830 [Leptospira kobayashii]